MSVEPLESAGYIELGRESPFCLGAMRVEPAIRQIGRDGRSQTVEPRVMQVLVALARAGGRVVTRDELVASCWKGVVVGENAVHRTISRLREIADAGGDDTFRIETIPRVGYRILAAEAPPPPAPPGIAARTAHSRPRRWAAPAAALVALTAAGLIALAVTPRPEPATVSLILMGEGAPEEARLASRTEAILARALGDRPVAVSTGTAAGAAASGYLVRVSMDPADQGGRAAVRVLDAQRGDLIWSESVERPAGRSGDLAFAVASLLSPLIDCAEQTRRDRERLDPASLRMFVGACQRVSGEPDDSSLSLLRTVARHHPRSASALAWLALDEALLAGRSAGDAAGDREAEPLRLAANEHIRQARRLGARPGLLRAAEAAVLPRPAWRERLALIDKGIAEDPDFSYLHRARADDLQQIGRMSEAIGSAQRAVNLAPLDAAARVALIDALAYGGQTASAQAEIANAARLWPDLPTIREATDRFEMRFGDPRAYLRRISAGGGVVGMWALEMQQGSLKGYLIARSDPTRANIRRAVLEAQRHDQGSPWVVQLYGSFDRIDEAYAALERPSAVESIRYGTETLFRPFMRSFRQDPRFMRLAARLGLAQAWRETGRWPDFCSDPNLRYDCRSEGLAAERALARR